MARVLYAAILWQLVAMAVPSAASSRAEEFTGVTLLGTFNKYASVQYNDIWGYTAPDGREYALLGVRSGTSIIDITEPGNAREIAFIPSASSSWKDIKTYKNYAYVVTDAQGFGLQIIDLSGLPVSATLAKTYTANSFRTSHNIFVDVANAMLYAEAFSGQSVRAISLQDPLNPVQLSTFGVSCHDIFARDNIVWIAEAGLGSVGIYDLNDPRSPSLISQFFIPNGGYAHNLWLTDDSRYLLTTEETQNRTVKIWDVQDKQNVELKGEFLGQSGLAHNVLIKGGFAYISHYADGLRILDLSDTDAPQEVAFYDTFPGSGTYVGAWGVYPYFASGKVLVSDISTGLYVLYFEGAVEKTTGIVDTQTPPVAFALGQNYPNPFNPGTRIPFRLESESTVSLKVFDTSGRFVRLLELGLRAAGDFTAHWDGRDAAGRQLASGVYYIELVASVGEKRFVQTRKAMLVR